MKTHFFWLLALLSSLLYGDDNETTLMYARTQSETTISLDGGRLCYGETIEYQYPENFFGRILSGGQCFMEMRFTPPSIPHDHIKSGSRTFLSVNPVISVSVGKIISTNWVPPEEKHDGNTYATSGFYYTKISLGAQPPEKVTVKYQYEGINIDETEGVTIKCFMEFEYPQLIPPIFYEEDRYSLVVDAPQHEITLKPVVRRRTNTINRYRWRPVDGKLLEISFKKRSEPTGQP